MDDYLDISGGDEQGLFTLGGLIVVLVLILLGIFAFSIAGYVGGGKGKLGAGVGLDVAVGRLGGKEGYMKVFPAYHGGKEGYYGMSKWYPYGSSRGPYRSTVSEGFLPQPKDLPAQTWSGGVWDTSAGQRSTASTAPWSTLMAYGESLYEGNLPQSRWRGWAR